MKKINSLTVQKGLCCITVFFCHFLDLTHTFSIEIFDKLFLAKDGFLRVFNCGNLAVDIFIIISGYLATQKVILSEKIRWDIEIIKRYFRLVIPCGVIAFISVLFMKMNLFCHYSIGIAQGNKWLYESHWGNRVGWRYAIRSTVYGILFEGDMKCYPAFWMMKYMFTGVVLALIIATVIKEMNWIGRVLTLVFLGFMFAYFVDPYYLCIVLSVLLAYVEQTKSDVVIKKIGIFIYIGGWIIGTYSLDLNQDPSKTVVRAFAAFVIIKGFMTLYEWIETHIKNWNGTLICRALIGLGNISFGVFCVHLLVMCTTASLWYQYFEGTSKYIQHGLNLIVSFLITVVFAILFNELLEKRLFKLLWKYISKVLWRNATE